MTSVNLVSEEEATGKVKETYEEIMESLGTDFVPNMYKAMANMPGLLEAHWNMRKAVMTPGKLDSLTKEIIAVSVSAVMGCDY